MRIDFNLLWHSGIDQSPWPSPCHQVCSDVWECCTLFALHLLSWFREGNHGLLQLLYNLICVISEAFICFNKYSIEIYVQLH